MEQLNDKYEKVLNVLRHSSPLMKSSEKLEIEVMNTVLSRKRSGSDINDLVYFIFGWTYNVWVRRSLITAATVMVLVFLFQQGIILKQINQLSVKINAGDWSAPAVNKVDLSKSMLLYRFRSRILPNGSKDISDKKVDDLLKSIDHLKTQYKDLHDLIEKDPELKKLIEKKLSEIDGSHIKL